MQNDVTKMLDLEFPIFAFSHCRDVVAAVSKAGGLGVLGAVAHTPEALDVDLRWIEDEIGDKPYGVDLIIPAKYAGDEDGGYTTDDLIKMIPAEHREFVDDILARYEVPPMPDDEGRAVAAWAGAARHPSRPTRRGRRSRSPSPIARRSWPTRSGRRRNT